MADLIRNMDSGSGDKQFSVVKNNESQTQRNWSNYFPKSGVTVYLKYIKDNDLSFIKVGKTLGGELPDESVEVFSPTTQGTIEAVAYFNDIAHNQDQQDNPPPPKEKSDNVSSIEDLIKAILDKMFDGEITFDDIEEQLQQSQNEGQGQGGDGDDEGGEPMDEDGQNPKGGEPMDEDGQNPFPNGGEPMDEDGQNPFPNGGEPMDEDGQNPFPNGGKPMDEDGQNPFPNGGDPTNEPIQRGTPIQQVNPNDVIEAIEDSMNINRGGLQNILSTKNRVMSRINLYNESELQQIANMANITGSRSEILNIVNQSLNTIYNG